MHGDNEGRSAWVVGIDGLVANNNGDRATTVFVAVTLAAVRELLAALARPVEGELMGLHEALRMGLAFDAGAEDGERLALRLYTVQVGQLADTVELDAYVRVHAGGKAVPLARRPAIDELAEVLEGDDTWFEIDAERLLAGLAPLQPPLLGEHEAMTVAAGEAGEAAFLAVGELRLGLCGGEV